MSEREKNEYYDPNSGTIIQPGKHGSLEIAWKAIQAAKRRNAEAARQTADEIEMQRAEQVRPAQNFGQRPSASTSEKPTGMEKRDLVSPQVAEKILKKLSEHFAIGEIFTLEKAALLFPKDRNIITKLQKLGTNSASLLPDLPIKLRWTIATDDPKDNCFVLEKK